MSYHPSHRKLPRQERWPDATPDQAWPAYVGADGYRDAQARGATETPGRLAGPPDALDGGDGFDGRASSYEAAGYRTLAEEYGGGRIAYGTRDEYAQAWDNGRGPDGYADPAGYADWDGYAGQDGYADRDGYAGPDGYADRDGYLDPGGWSDADDYAGVDGYAERVPGQWQAATGPMLVAPDTMGELGWLPRDRQDRPEPGRGRLIIGAVTGFLAAAVAIGVSTFVAAFVRPQASPIIAVGGAFIDRTPSAVKNFAIQYFGENDKTMLLLGMYAMIAVLAMVIGCLARRNAAVGVAGIAVFGLFGAFVAITRPDSHLTDVVPSVIGGLAGIAAFLWLASAAAPVTTVRHTRGGRRREAW